VPLRDGRDAMSVNWLQVRIRDARGGVTRRNAFVIGLTVDVEKAADIAACGRALWKTEREGFNIFKQGGYKLERNLGRVQRKVDAVLVALNLLAFAFHAVCDLAERAWQRARQTVSSGTKFFETLQAMTAYLSRRGDA
jgi:hypothetical protein